MRYPIKLFLSLSFFSFLGFSQNSIDEAIEKFNTGSINYISVEALKDKLDAGQDLILLDTRAKKEFRVSHLKNAIWVGYDNFDIKKVKQLDKNTEIVVYCSIGVRSEQIGEQLKAMGFKNINNLYGGIFEWSNQGYPVYQKGNQTQKVHAYDKFWGKFLERGQKIF
ncbi:rhodanese-like domain-containing protein [Mesohalobacter halotolerans]|uniref:Rhodanese-like domain-containing protein n=1 Tax=Mesohalobacter halotolerans TaxID=1883405 RepID=A0A4U5TR18_9FLAO|nr:rhodanese-like domain-containing protein [Mesohalobacter halotolerans]MBS3739739.1 rhodanese-like domain-containing protein [Psychroflexus sp.]TKS55814.1 rhodanese-like domain-containing protein [Mesohalobacter halotolerans]